MITKTTFKHPKAQQKLREAAFEAAADVAGIQLRDCLCGVDVTFTPGRLLRFTDYYSGHIVTDKVASAMGCDGFFYMEQLARALAAPSIEKVWK